MPNGGRLTVETRAITIRNNSHRALLDVPDGDYVEISVCDTGLGMTEDIKARIFEPFFSTKGVGKGTGLGLATVYGIVKQNEGFITVDSRPEHGTTFYILLPVCYSESVPTSPAVTLQRRSAGGSETILLAEDEPLVRQLAVISLTALGYNVLEADCGETAILLASQHNWPLHLLITDVVMPGISGTELARRLRVIHPDIPVLYMSGYTDDAVVRHGEFTSMDDFVQKPFSPNLLATKVRHLLDVGTLTPGG
jgi:CheY-like chemotaxis protein